MDQIKFEIKCSRNDYQEPLEISWNYEEHNAVKVGNFEFHYTDLTEIRNCLQFIEDNCRSRFG